MIMKYKKEINYTIYQSYGVSFKNRTTMMAVLAAVIREIVRDLDMNNFVNLGYGGLVLVS
jgi:hypothetical protein